METTYYDLAVIGGGINGVAIARDAAGRGLRVLLIEKDDLASHTSSASTKLIHGGLRYLESYQFRLVREALKEREVILAIAPHITWPLRFVLPHEPGHRPAWLVRLGLFLYDHIAPRETLPGTETINLKRHPIGASLRHDLTTAFIYSDGWVEDSRLVTLTALDAAERGATILTRTMLQSAQHHGDVWQLELTSGVNTVEICTARVLVNAAGPWTSEVRHQRLGIAGHQKLRLVKGSHIVVPSLYPGEHAFIFQNSDQRIVFAIPYEGSFTLIGTTDEPYSGDPSAPYATTDEIAYLCKAVNQYFKRNIRAGDVVWSYSGVRPLFDDGQGKASAVSRDYVFALDSIDGKAPVLSIFGGKITTHREMAQRALEMLRPLFPNLPGNWTQDRALPGGDIPGRNVQAFIEVVLRRWPFLTHQTARRLVRAYGTRVDRFLGDATSFAALGGDLGLGLSEAELAYLVKYEWARTPEDILWRRSKLGLHLSRQSIEAVAQWLAQHSRVSALHP